MPRKLISLLVVWAILFVAPSLFAQEPFDPAKLDFFETYIRPVLIEHCYECHSSDSKIVQGSLRLDDRDSIRAGGDSGPSVVPGDLDASLILEALRYESFEMPPDGQLSQNIIADFEKWISDGAVDPRDSTESVAEVDWDKARKHWAFQPVIRPSIPAIKDDTWPKTDIDRLLFNKLESKGMRPSPAADDYDLVRRIYFDLIGIPPTPDQVQTFVDSPSPDRVEELVDQLLASPHLGERWGRHWLDVARYSDSSGGGRVLIFHDAWRYRDYVVKSLNDDKPIDQFMMEQIAGDVLPSADYQQRADQLTATGFLMLGPHNYELQDKELLRMEIVDEQIDVVGRAFLGLTLGCARCHDHKFDPVSTEEYYSLAGIFRSTHSVEHANVSRFFESELPLNEENQIKLDEFKDRSDTITKQIDEINQLVGGLTSSISEQALDLAALGGTVVDDRDAALTGKWSEGSSVKPFVQSGYQYSNDKTAKAVYEFEIPDDGKFEFRVSYTPHPNRSKKTRVALIGSETKQETVIDQTKTPGTNGLFQTIGTLQCQAGQTVSIEILPNGNGFSIIDAAQMIPLGQAETTETEVNGLNELQAQLSRLGELQKQLDQLKKNAPKPPPKVMSVREGDDTGDYFVCIRGDAHRLSEEPVRRAALSAMNVSVDLGIQQGSSGRLELAKWIASDKNPLTARVYVNRVWLHLMGEGLVTTADNFGLMGQPPAHAELLDYLTAEFVDHDWSTKRLIREIMTSAVYQQSPDDNAAYRELDPDNHFFWRGNRRRLDVEAIRDSILSFSGQLDLTMGGPVVPKDLKREFGYEHRSNRRSIYLPIFRNTLHDMLDVFDFPNPNLVAGKRNESTLPAQALYLMNSPFVIEQSEHAAKRMLAIEDMTSGQRIDRAFEIALGRLPTASEKAATLEFLNQRTEFAKNELEIWSDICQTLISSLDFRYVR